VKYPSLAKRGKGRFCGTCRFNFETLNRNNIKIKVSPCLLKKISQFVGGLPFFGHLNSVSIHKRNGFDIAKSHTLWITVTIVAFYSDPLLDIKERLTKWAGDDAGSASDTEIPVNDHTVLLFRFSVAGLGRTNLDAEGFFAMIAGHGEIKSHLFPFDHSDTGTTRIACPGMINRAHQLALTAARAFLLINHQHLLLHFNSPSERFRSFEHLGFEFRKKYILSPWRERIEVRGV
jgi:hypothetical protein